jgi:hypothetical protein
LDALERAKISTEGQRGYHLLARAGLEGLICFGPQAGYEQTFALLDEWVPGARDVSRAEGLAILAGRYFASHGPATLEDFAHWTGLAKTEARAGLEAAQGQLVRESVGGMDYWLAADAPALPKRNAEVYLLPGFDEFLLGYKDRCAVLDARHAAKVFPGGGTFRATVLIGGQVAGTWKRTLKKGELMIEAEPFRPLTAGERRALAQAAGRYGEYLGMAAEAAILTGAGAGL